GRCCRRWWPRSVRPARPWASARGVEMSYAWVMPMHPRPTMPTSGPVLPSVVVRIPGLLLPPGSGTDEHLERLAAGHRPVAVRHVLKADGAVEHAARLDRAVEYVGQQPLDVGASRCDATGERDVAPEHVEADRRL